MLLRTCPLTPAMTLVSGCGADRGIGEPTHDAMASDASVDAQGDQSSGPGGSDAQSASDTGVDADAIGSTDAGADGIVDAGLDAAVDADIDSADAPDDVNAGDVLSEDRLQDVHFIDAALAPSDLAVLFPLPSTLEHSPHLRLHAQGAHGQLLSHTQFEAITAFQSDPTVGYERFRIVGARLDPCFPDLTALKTAPQTCHKQLRLVAQPLEDTDQGTSAHDSAIHLLYELDAASFEDVLNRVRTLRGNRPVDPAEILAVSRAMTLEGENGLTAGGWRDLISQHVGTDNLARFTFVHGNEAFSWAFGGFEVKSAEVVPLAIPGVADSGHDQSVSGSRLVSISPSTALATSMQPLIGRLDCATNVAGCDNMVLDAPPAEMQAALQVALNIENPEREHVGTVDCASCHLAGPLRTRAGQLGHPTMGLESYQSAYNTTLGNSAEYLGQPSRVRAFGYFHRDAVLSQRLVNEAAAVAEAINR